MAFSLAIKVFVFYTCLILITDESQGAPMKANYIILRPGDMRRLKHILKGAGDFQIDPKPWNKRENYDEKTTTTRPTLGEFSGPSSPVYTNELPNLVSIGTLPPPSGNNIEEAARNARRSTHDWFLPSFDDVPVYYVN